MSINLFGPRSSGDSGRAAEVKRWVSRAFGLADDVSVMVTELRCSEPDCPPIETVIAIMDRPGQPRQHKLHKPLAEVAFDDVAALARGADHQHRPAGAGDQERVPLV